MNINTQIDNDTATIVLEGKLTVQSAPDLEAAIDDLQKDVKNVDIDLSSLDYISSAGLRVLVSAQKMLGAHDGTLRLLNPNDEVNDVFEMTGLSEVFNIVR